MDAVKVEENIEIDSVNENIVKNESLVTELHFELLKQYAWLGSAIIGALVVLIQLGTITVNKNIYISLACFSLSIVISILGQDYLVERLTNGDSLQKLSKKLKLIRHSSFMLIAFGAGFSTPQFI
jgi:hypothetical protein